MLLDALPAHTAILDRDGVITEVNDAWRVFASENGLCLPGSGVGVNYLELCHATLGPAHRLCIDLGALLQGRTALITWAYPCHAPTKQRWFNLIGVRRPDGRGGAMLSHVDITDLIGGQALVDGPVVETSRPALVPISILPSEAGTAGSDSAGGIVADGLSTRQREVLTLLRQGRTVPEIATTLGVSVRTAKIHVAAVLRRVGAASDLQPHQDALRQAQHSARRLRRRLRSPQPR